MNYKTSHNRYTLLISIMFLLSCEQESIMFEVNFEFTDNSFCNSQSSNIFIFNQEVLTTYSGAENYEGTRFTYTETFTYSEKGIDLVVREGSFLVDGFVRSDNKVTAIYQFRYIDSADGIFEDFDDFRTKLFEVSREWKDDRGNHRTSKTVSCL